MRCKCAGDGSHTILLEELRDAQPRLNRSGYDRFCIEKGNTGIAVLNTVVGHY